MEKIKERIKNIKINRKISLVEIIVISLILFAGMMGTILTIDIDDLDIMWVFSFASKITEGATPYLDYNMVITPLASQITAFFLNIFGNTMMVSAFLGAIYGSLIFLFQYLILRKMNISIKASIVITVMFFIALSNNMWDTYNTLAYLLVYITIFIQICKIRYDKYVKITNKEKYVLKEKNKITYSMAYNIVTGILLGLIVITKQNIGAVAILAITIYYFAKWIFKQTTFKNVFSQLCIMAIFCLIVVDIELIYLLLAGALYSFLDYTVLGLNSFANKVGGNLFASIFSTGTLLPGSLKIQLMQVFSNMFICLRNIALIFSFAFLLIMIITKLLNKMNVKNKVDINEMILSFCFMFVGLIISVPLANTYHLKLTAGMIIFLGLINILKIIPLSKWLRKSISKVSCYIMLLIPLVVGISYLSIYFTCAYKSQIPSFKNMYISSTTEQRINDTVRYIQEYEEKNGHRLYVISSRSAVYANVMKINNGIFDLPQYGNLGKEDYMAVINKLDSMNDFSVMVYKDESSLFWQEPKEIRQYVMDNYEYVEDFDIYSVYYKP